MAKVANVAKVSIFSMGYSMGDEIRLSGGVLFALLLRMKQAQPRYSERYNGVSGGCADPDILLGLTKIVTPDKGVSRTEVGTAKDNTRRFKDCSGNAPFFRLNDQSYIAAFNNQIQSDYSVLLKRTSDFVKEYMDLDEALKKDLVFVKGVLELLALDESITNEEKFFVLENGQSLTKLEILSSTHIFCFESFLLGMWHYALCEIQNNMVGKETYDCFWKSNDGQERLYTAMLGERSTRSIQVTHYLKVDSVASEEINREDPAEEVDNVEVVEPVAVDRHEKQKTVNFNISGGNNSFYSNVGTVINGEVKNE